MSDWKQFSGRITAAQMEQVKAIRNEKNFNSDIAVLTHLLENPGNTQTIEVEKIVEVEKPLTENQFLVDFNEENAQLIESVCDQLKIKGATKAEKFHNLTELALGFYISEKYKP